MLQKITLNRGSTFEESFLRITAISVVTLCVVAMERNAADR